MLHAGAINWTYTLGVGLMDPFARGASAVLYNGPADASVWPRLIARFGATIFAAVPGVYRQMLRAALLHGGKSGEPAPWRHGRRGARARASRAMAGKIGQAAL